MAGRKTSLYLSEQLAAQVEASGVPLAELVRRGLAAGEPEPIDDRLRRIMRDELATLPDADTIDRILRDRLSNLAARSY